MIPFNRPPVIGTEPRFLQEVLEGRKLCGDGPFTKRCHEWFERRLSVPKALLTTSCTHALEMAALLLDLKPGDEVIVPSYTFVSTASAFAVHGAQIVFVDIRPDTMNMDETLIEAALTPRTKAIVVVHYAGVSCEMDTILELAGRHGLAVIEDAAQGVEASYRGRPLGTLSHAGCFSFHETKNISCGEGGLLALPRTDWADRAEILREKGTDRARFFRGMVDKYTWVDLGSSYLPSELNAACLWSQLEGIDAVQASRHETWNFYRARLGVLENAGRLDLPVIPEGCQHNAHMFYLKVRDLEERTKLIGFLKEREIQAVFHYIPLHSSPQGKRSGRFHGEDRWTTKESERILRLPIWYGMSSRQADEVCSAVEAFFEG